MIVGPLERRLDAREFASAFFDVTDDAGAKCEYQVRLEDTKMGTAIFVLIDARSAHGGITATGNVAYGGTEYTVRAKWRSIWAREYGKDKWELISCEIRP